MTNPFHGLTYEVKCSGSIGEFALYVLRLKNGMLLSSAKGNIMRTRRSDTGADNYVGSG
jgi:hypothetical protein